MTAETFALTVLDGDAEPRIRDLELAVRLGLRRLYDVRRVIGDNRAELEAYGLLRVAPANSADPLGRGRPTNEFWLTEEQALAVAALSRTEKAAKVRRMLILAFTAWRRGQMITRADLEQVVSQMVEQRLGADPRVAVSEYVPTLKVLADHGVPPHKRHRFVVACTKRLQIWCLQRGATARHRHADGSGPWCFPVDQVDAWLKAEGLARIRRHIDAVRGQMSMDLQRPPFDSKAH